jgi:hypothetical protein
VVFVGSGGGASVCVGVRGGAEEELGGHEDVKMWKITNRLSLQSSDRYT